MPSPPPPDVPRRWADVDPATLPSERTGVLVLGAGVAGLRAAIAAAAGRDVTVLTKGAPADSATAHAQGGIAVAWGDDDTPVRHGADTVEVGQGLCDPEAVRILAREAAPRLQELIDWGARFDREGTDLALGREGGHSAARIVHARGDATGAEVMRVLLERAAREPRLTVRPGCYAVDLISDGRDCAGAIVHDGAGVRVLRAGATIVATGGAGQLYRETTNPPGATGDGIAAAYRAGAAVGDAEFMQFHPTALYVAGAARTLISEACRGEGGVLRNARGEPFMHRVHADGDLAPRDVVSRAILEEGRRVPGPVTLDLRSVRNGDPASRFPGIAAACRAFGLDIARDPIPVVPSAHYFVGGIRTDLRGRSTLGGLWACGEAASCGVHGANRLASNSLLEGLVLGARAGTDAASSPPPGSALPPLPTSVPGVPEPHGFDRLDLWNSLRSLLWRQAGIEREDPPLEDALARIRFWGGYLWRWRFADPGGWTLQNAMLLAHMVAASALERTESRGVHYRRDFPARDDARWRVHIVHAFGRPPERLPAAPLPAAPAR